MGLVYLCFPWTDLGRNTKWKQYINHILISLEPEAIVEPGSLVGSWSPFYLVKCVMIEGQSASRCLLENAARITVLKVKGKYLANELFKQTSYDLHLLITGFHIIICTYGYYGW